MYKSLKLWMNVPVQLHRFVSIDGAGDNTYSEPTEILVYPVSDVTVVRNAKGIEVTSKSQLFVDGHIQISDMDRLDFEDRNTPIQAIHTFYRNGVPDLKVVYL